MKKLPTLRTPTQGIEGKSSSDQGTHIFRVAPGHPDLSPLEWSQYELYRLPGTQPVFRIDIRDVHCTTSVRFWVWVVAAFCRAENCSFALAQRRIEKHCAALLRNARVLIENARGFPYRQRFTVLIPAPGNIEPSGSAHHLMVLLMPEPHTSGSTATKINIPSLTLRLRCPAKRCNIVGFTCREHTRTRYAMLSAGRGHSTMLWSHR